MTAVKGDDDFYMENELLLPYNHLQQDEGKPVRVQMVVAFNHWLKVPKDKLHQALKAFGLFHSGGLLIDDIQDQTLVRRGSPAAHCVYGVPLTINASFHVCLLAMRQMHDISPMAGKIATECFLDVIRGQGLELSWREHYICPTEEEFKDMVQRKTGASYLMSVRTLQLFSKDQTDYTQFVKLLGLYYQIRDDYCNLNQQEETTGCFSEDLTEGKFSLPIIHALRTNTTEAAQIMEIHRQRTRDIELKRRCMSLLEKTGSLQYTRDVLRDLDTTLRAELVRLGGNPQMEAVFDELLSWQDLKSASHSVASLKK